MARDFSTFLNSRNISACLDQAIQTRKPLGISLINSQRYDNARLTTKELISQGTFLGHPVVVTFSEEEANGTCRNTQTVN